MKLLTLSWSVSSKNHRVWKSLIDQCFIKNHCYVVCLVAILFKYARKLCDKLGIRPVNLIRYCLKHNYRNNVAMGVWYVSAFYVWIFSVCVPQLVCAYYLQPAAHLPYFKRWFTMYRHAIFRGERNVLGVGTNGKDLTGPQLQFMCCFISFWYVKSFSFSYCFHVFL